MMLSLRLPLLIVKMALVGNNTTLMMAISCVLTRFVFPRVLCVCYFCKNHMAADSRFGRSKTYDMLANKFVWPRMFRDVGRFVCRCTTCGKVKFKAQSHGLASTRGGAQSRHSSLSALHRQSSQQSRPAGTQFSMITTSISICAITLSGIVLTTVLWSGSSSAQASRSLISSESHFGHVRFQELHLLIGIIDFTLLRQG